MKKVGFGIIGTGNIADLHARALENTSNAYLVAVFDIVSAKAESFAKKYGCKYYASLDEFLSDEQIEAVTITTPSGYHLDPALKAIEAGKHVLIEKPLEITPERCDAIIDASRKKGVKLSGIFQSRFHDAARLVKKAVEEKRFGRIVLADAYVKWYRSQEYYDSGAWRGTKEVDGGGALMNQGIHAVDLLLYLMGDVVKVGAFTSTLAHKNIEVEDTGVSILRFANGALGCIEASTGSYPGSLKKIEIRGDRGSAVIEEESLTEWTFMDERPEDEEIRKKYINATKSGGGASDPMAIQTHGHEAQFDDFAAAIREDRDPYITGEEAARSVRLLSAIYRSGDSGAFECVQR